MSNGIFVFGHANVVGQPGAGNLIEDADTTGITLGSDGTVGSYNSVQGNTIESNPGIGVFVNNGQPLIGGNTGFDGNTISDNARGGLEITGANSVVVAGNSFNDDGPFGVELTGGATGVQIDEQNEFGLNAIGVLITGTGTDDNSIDGFNVINDNTDGIEITGGASGNTISGNSISANTDDGVEILGVGTLNNSLFGNTIGDDANIGVLVIGSSSPVGGTVTVVDNTIYDDSGGGLELSDASNSVVQSNDFGVNQFLSLGGNGPFDIELTAGASDDTIGGTTAQGNLIGDDTTGDGVEINGTGTSSNVVAGNLIGTDITGKLAVPNANGVVITGGSTGNTIGGTTSTARNVISGNSNTALQIQGTGSSGNVVEGNYIGVDVTGDAALGNFFGIQISGSGNTIGGTAPGAGNIIAGNDGTGSFPAGSQIVFAGNPGFLADDNSIEGNFIGLDANGQALAGATGAGILFDVLTNGDTTGNTIGGTSAGARNVISGNIDGLLMAGDNGNLVEGNYIGTDPNGTIAIGNGVGFSDVELQGAMDDTIGGTTAGARNILSGATYGVFIGNQNAIDNVVEGNYIGTDDSGTLALPNSSGVFINDTRGGNTIGGATTSPGTGAGNLIAGNSTSGINLNGDQDDVIEGNAIGIVDLVDGGTALGNTQGIEEGDSSGVTIGGPSALDANIISGNSEYGIAFNISSNDLIQGNLVGTNATGTGAVPNGVGISVGFGGGNTIGGTTAAERNVISGNTGYGVVITACSGNLVEGNYIGTDIAGTLSIPNVQDGVAIDSGATGNTIGGLTTTPGTGPGNLISGNDDTSANVTDGSGVLITGAGTTGNVVEGNLVGTNALDTGGVGNSLGVIIASGASNNTVGGGTPGASNVISGNLGEGVWVIFGGTNSNLIAGNFVGTEMGGTVPLGNGFNGVEINQAGSGNIIGGVVATDANVIAGNTGAGIFIFGSPGVVVQGNYIGTNPAGLTGLGNSGRGVLIESNSPSTVIGGVNELNPDGTVKVLHGNVISGNAVTGIQDTSSAGGLLAEGNFIGTDPTGNIRMGNGFYGIILQVSSNTIGGTVPGAGNVISGNASDQIFLDGLNLTTTDNLIEGNKIGTNYAGTAAIADTAADGTGVDIFDSDGNTVGGTTAAAGNLISGHVQWGVNIEGGSTGNLVAGNEIGTNLAGTAALPNGGQVNPGTPSGGVDVNDSPGNTIGGSSAGTGNLISGNDNYGIDIDGSASTVVQGNLIGTDVTGKLAVPNAIGVEIDDNSTDNTIGGTTTLAQNVISGNLGNGLEIRDTGSSGNVVEGNYIGVDATGNAALGNSDGILLFASANIIGGTDAGAGNIIAGNDGTGTAFDGAQILIAGNPGLASDDNAIEGNYIGLDANGQALAGATGAGIAFDELTAGDTTGNTIGGTTADARNVISGNLVGIGMEGDSGNLVEGNFIGTDPTGTIAIGNGGGGDIDIDQGASDDTIGGTTAGARNIISGDDTPSGGAGVGIDLATDLVVEGNYIGTDVTGTVALPNYKGIDFGPAINNDDTIGGVTTSPGTGAGNLIAGNDFGSGINLFGSSGLVVIEGNAIGRVLLPGVGTSPGNGNDGIDIIQSTGVQIGGPNAQNQNVISGNASDGVEIDESSTVLVEGNLIGTDITGKIAVPNANGIVLDNGSTDNTIGGTTVAQRNVISGNTNYGVEIIGAFSDTSDVIEGNYIGVDVTGDAALPNACGIFDSNGVNNIIGGTIAGSGNVISGNDGSPSVGSASVLINGTDDLIAGNIVGLTEDGATLSVVSIPGIWVGNDVTIGGTAAGAGNTISGNNLGLVIDGGSGTLVQGNFIGTDLTGTVAIGNGPSVATDYDVLVAQASDVTIGGTTAAARNIISGAAYGGVGISQSSDVLVEGNYIGTDVTGTIALPNLDGVDSGDESNNVTIGGATSTPGTGAGNLIAGNSRRGVTFAAGQSGNAVVEGNVIGVADIPGVGTTPANGFSGGLYVQHSPDATGLIIGGTSTQDENVISGNAGPGITLDNAGGVVIEGNLIGTNLAGTAAVPNTDGIQLDDESAGDTIGGTAAGAANVISGNTTDGILMDVGGALGLPDAPTQILVEGNLIGTDITGMVAVPNANGVVLDGGSTDNTIGGTTAAARNVISGNTTGDGVFLANDGSNDNVVEGDYIGVDVTGDAALPNAFGVDVDANDDGNTIGGTASGAGNVISGNNDGNAAIASQVYLPGDDNLVEGNLIGLGSNGLALTVPASDLNAGVSIEVFGLTNEGVGNTIGGVTASARNVISGNVQGILIQGGGSDLIEGNYIGTDPTGTIAIGNGPAVDSNSGDVGLTQTTNDTIGGTTAAARNIISGAENSGVFIGDGTTDSVVEGNYIGTDVTGTVALPNTSGGIHGGDEGAFGGNTIGGATSRPGTGAGNLIAGNINGGLNYFQGNGDVIEGNAIGSVALPGGGTSPGNGRISMASVVQQSGGFGIEIGGPSPLDENVISGNSGDGIEINDSSAVLVEGNLIGTDITGMVAVPNANGVVIESGSIDNTIGGTTVAQRNVISGNTNGDGVLIVGTLSATSELIEGNYIGVDITGDAALPNGFGVEDSDGGNNTIGGTAAGAGNVISGNDSNSSFSSEVFIQGQNDLVEGNLIGLGANGLALANATNAGVFLGNEAFNDTIGGVTTAARNVISGNVIGITIEGGGSILIEGNYIGTDPTGTIAIGNGTTTDNSNIDINLGISSNNTIGGDTPGARNIISGGSRAGVFLGDLTTDTLIEGNYIGTDVSGTVALPNRTGIIGEDGDNTIGGATSTPGTGAGNLIAGNSNGGIAIGIDPGSILNSALIQGNVIGSAAMPGGGTSPGNGADGIMIGSPADGPIPTADVQIGGTDPMDENVISGNAGDGIEINDSTAVLVEGNLIGTDITGKLAVPNASGVAIDNGSSGNTIGGTTAAERNIISGNTSGDGVFLANDGSNDNLVEGDYIGVDVTGDASLPNAIGVFVASNGNTIGGTAAGSGDVISGNDDGSAAIASQVYLPGDDNLVEGNLIGLGADGLAVAVPAGDLNAGVYIDSGGFAHAALGNTIGGVTALARNVIAGNDLGITILGSGFDLVEGNYIGTDPTGTIAIGNGPNTDANPDGVNLGDTTHDTIGGTTAGARNIISGNFGGAGIKLGDGTTDTVVEGNYIGTDVTGTVALPNDDGGIVGGDEGTFGGNTIGGATSTPGTGAGNLVAGNINGGISYAMGNGDVVEGNAIGKIALPGGGTSPGNEDFGILVQQSGGSGVVIGGPSPLDENVISGNSGNGIEINDGSAVLVEGNLIGISVDGKIAIGNVGAGVLIEGTTGAMIGGSATGAGNTICGTTSSSPGTGYGIEVEPGSVGTVIQGNVIGGVAGFGNHGAGIYDPSSSVTIGGPGTTEGNLIAYNGGPGIYLGEAAAEDSSVARNQIAGNSGLGIAIDLSGDSRYPSQNFQTTPALNIPGGQLNAPVITSATIDFQFLTVSGYARPGSIIEFDAALPDSTHFGQGAFYLGTFTVGSAGDYDSALPLVSYSSPIYGSDTNAERYQFTFAIPSVITPGMVVTSISEGKAGHPSISEFGVNDTSSAAIVALGPILYTGGNATILAGQTYAYRGSFGDNSSVDVTATVNYGDGTGIQNLVIDPVSPQSVEDEGYVQPIVGFFELSHVYLEARTYNVLVTMTDGSNLTSTSMLTVTVVPAPPKIVNTGISLAPASDPSNTSTPAVVAVDKPVLLKGSFTDSNAGDSPTVELIWGDGSVSFPTAAEAGSSTSYSFSATHAYTAPSADVGKQGLYPVAVIITDGDGQSSSTTEGLFYSEVLDTPPSDVVAVTSSATVAAGGTELLSASFNAPQDPGDLYHVVVNWGDGSSPTTFDLTNGQTSFPSLSHTYLAQPSYKAGTPDTITVSVTDPFQPLAPAIGTASVSIAPTSSSSLTIRTDNSTIEEGDSVNLSGTLLAAVPSDPHDLTIHWGDGTSSQVGLAAGVSTFSGIEHPYALNSLGQPGGDYVISVTATDPSRSDLAPALATTNVTVLDVAPTVSDLTLTNLQGSPLTSTPEDSIVVVNGHYTNPGGVLDHDTVTINWGDGTTSQAAVNSSTDTFTAQHPFGDNPGQSVSILNTVTATATDSEGAHGSGSVGLTLFHVTPAVAITSAGFVPGTAQPILAAPVSAGGDTRSTTYTWSLNNQVVSSTSTYLPPIPDNADAIEFVSVVVTVVATDGYTATSSFSAEVDLVNDDTNSTYDVLAPGMGGDSMGVESIIVIDVKGGKTIDGSAATTTPIIFDGTGAETFIGDEGPDQFDLHTDGASAYAVGDHNTFMLTPNCTLTAVADPGSQYNTLDFSTATYGVTFNLQLADGTSTSVTPQNVDTADLSADHIVATNNMGNSNAFTTLVCSDMSDDITAATGSTIVGGAGLDTVNLPSVSDVTVDGSAGGNMIVSSGSNVGNITYDADTDASSLTSVNFMNTGSITGDVSFFGDQGSTTFNNNGTVLGASTTGTISFTGDQGSTTFNNTPNASTGGTIAFTGDQGSATFNNAAATTSGGAISFSGDQGSATFNNGPIAIAISYTGDQGSATFGSGPATTSATISFSGDLGSNTFNNGPGGTTAGTIAFTGDQGSATFNNGVLSGTTAISFTGDQGSTTFSNGVTTGSISFTGDQGSATFNNGPGASQTGAISFQGDQSSATFNNGSTAGSATISFTGDQGSTTFSNSGTVSSGAISFTGDGSSATFNNGPGASQTGSISFSGDQSSSTFNNGAVAIAISYTGDQGSATFGTGTATTSGTIVFSGDQGSATFNNGPGASQTGSISFSGDQGSATFNNGVLSGTTTISFTGDQSSATFSNGVNTGSIVFTGDQGSATFNNGPGASQTGSISFTGDQSSATFNNGSTAGSATIVFSGDQGSATFTNSVTVSSGPISFSGDGGSATFNNAPGAIQSGTISFTGDQSTNTFNNGPGASQTGSISFGGDDGGNSGQGGVIGDQNSNTFNNGPGAFSTGQISFTGDQTSATFNNSPGATQTGAISFQGDQSSSTFNNSPGATQTGAISFSGDQSSNTFINGASTSGLISFSGDGNAELLWNQGTFASGIVFDGGSEATSSTLVNTGTIGGTVTFTGNAGSDAFYNGAIVNGTLLPGTVNGNVVFNGGTGSGSLVNDGTVVGSITFQDGAASVSSIESLVNLGEVSGSITFNGFGGTDSLDNTGLVGGSLTFNAGGGTNTLINASTASVGSIVFMGNSDSPVHQIIGGSAVPTPANQVLNQENGLSSVTYQGGEGGNLLVNDGNNVGSIQFVAIGDDSVLENSGNSFGSITFSGSSDQSTLINTGNANAAGTSTIKYYVEADPVSSNDTLENSGEDLASIDMSAGDGTTRLVNIGDDIGQIAFDGGDSGGTLLNAGSDVGSLDDDAEGSTQIFRNDGLNVGSLAFQGTDGTDYFLNNGSTGALTYVSGSLDDTIINAGSLIASASSPPNPSPVPIMIMTDGDGALSLYNAPGGMVSGVTIDGPNGAFSFENAGTITDSTIDAQPSASGSFINDVGGTLTNVTYMSSSAGDTVQNYGFISGFTFDGGVGTGELDLYGSKNVNVTYNGGTGGDTLVIGTDAGEVSGITFNGNDGDDLLASDASDVSNVVFNAGLGSATLWSEGEGASGLKLVGSSGAATLDNDGDDATNLTLFAGSGGGTINNFGNDFGLIYLIGGSGANALNNAGNGTAASSLDLTGGDGGNTLTTYGNGIGSIALQDAAGVDAADVIDNTGNDIGSIVMMANTGVSSLINAGDGDGSIFDVSDGGEPSITNSGGVGSLTFDAGSGNATLDDSADNGPTATISYIGGGADDMFVDSASAASACFNAEGGGSQVVIQTGVTGTITLVEGTGSNDFLFNGTPQAAITIDPAAVPGTIDNTLDFSTYFGGGLDLDLMKTTPQTIAGGMTLTLGNPEEISSVVGTQYTNKIYGNDLADTLYSAALSDPTTATNYTTPSVPNATTQWAYLDFTSFDDPVNGQAPFVYTAADQQAVIQGLEADYWGPGGAANPWFNDEFTTNLADIPPALVASGSYVTLYFNETPPTDESGGFASEIDFGNIDPGGYAEIQVNGLLGGTGDPAATSANYDTLSVKVAAHEFAHLQGVRHSDAFGPIGFGVHTPPGSAEFTPDTNTPGGAFETDDAIISSPATDGTSRVNDLGPLFFGPRQAIKLAFGEQDTTVPSTGGNHTFTTAMGFPLTPLEVPNTDVNSPGIEAGMNLQVVAGAVSDQIGLGSNGLAAPDYYSFTGQKGQDFTIETESQELPALANGGDVDTVISVYDSSGNLVPYYGGVATNDDQFEGTDSLLDDVILPATGTYYVKVTSFAAPAGDPDYIPSNPQSPLNSADTASILNPVNPDYDPAERAAYIAAGNGTATGAFDLFIYRESQADPTTDNVNNVLMAPGGGSTLASSGQGDTLVGGSGTDSYQVGSDTITVSSSSIAPVVDLNAASLFSVSIADTQGKSGWPVTIYYGDGTESTTEAEGGVPLELSHAYPGTGSYTVTIDYQVGGNKVEMTVPITMVEAQAPTSQITSIPTAPVEVKSPATFSATIQMPYADTPYTASWTFTNQGTGQQSFASQPVESSTAAPSLPFTLTESFATSGSYLVQLDVTNSLNDMSSVATFSGGLPTFTVVAQVATSVSVNLPGTTLYNGEPYAPPASSIVVKDASGNVIANPSLSYSYSQVTPSGLTPLSQPPTDAGTYQLVVTYAGDSTHPGSKSQPATFIISPATPQVALSGPASLTYDNQAYPLPTISVTGVNNSHLSTLGVTLAYYQVTSGGLVSIAGSPTNAGAYQVVATYTATLDYTSAMSAAFNFVILPASTTITGSVSGLVFGLPTKFTATVRDGSGTPSGSVDFYDTTTGIDLGSATLSGSGVATLTPSAPLPAESQTITLTYETTANMASSSTTVAANVVSSIFVLNATASGALNLSGSASISVPGTVQVDSSSSSAVELSGAAKVTAGTIGVVGGTSVTGSASFSVEPTKDASIPDPFVNLPVPSAVGLSKYAAVNLGGVSVSTISPGIYPSISVAGSAKLTMQPGVYVITGGGFSVGGAGIVTGSCVLIYNAGSNFNGGSGSTFGAISLSAGTVNLSPPTTGVYAGISFFQSRDNTKTMTISGALEAKLNGGAVYASAALLQITGSGEIGGSGEPASPLVVNELLLSGAAQALPGVAIGAGSESSSSTGSGSSASTGSSTASSSSTGSSSSSSTSSGSSIAIPTGSVSSSAKHSPTPAVIDTALASLYPSNSTSPLSSGNVQQIDAAIDAFVQESYLVPVEIAQDVQESTASDAGTLAVRKPSSALSA